MTDREKIKRLEKENKKLHEELKKLKHLAQLGKMIGFIAHQCKQPLNVVAVLAQAIQDAYDFDELTLEILERNLKAITGTANQMSQMMNSFRNLNKPNKNKEKFNVKNTIEKVIYLLISYIYKQNNIELILDLADKCEIKEVQNELFQVILAILNNAGEAFQKDSIDKKVNIKLFKQGDKIIIKISDNAGGISDNLLEKIFEPYFTTKNENQGTGLGLSMSKEIIERMNGKISVQNIENENEKGTEFKIVLPSA